MSSFGVWWTRLALAAPAAGVLLGGAVFAAPLPPQSPPNPATLTVNYVGLQQTSTGIDGLVVKVSNLVVPAQGSPPDTVNFDLATPPGMAPVGFQSGITESVPAGAPTYATWFVPLNVPKGTPLSQLSVAGANLNVNEWNYAVPSGQELAVGGLSPIGTLPFGQLPEVPWAAALPLLAVGTGVLAWRRRLTRRALEVP